MPDGADRWAAARDLCLHDCRRCADFCEETLAQLGGTPADERIRHELTVCAAVCRVANETIDARPHEAALVAALSVEACERCAAACKETGDPRLAVAGRMCEACAESTAAFLDG